MVNTATEWRHFGKRLLIASIAVAAGIAVLGVIRQWPTWAAESVPPTLLISGLGLALWSALAVRGRAAAACFIVALITLGIAVCVGAIGLLWVACLAGHCVSFD